MRAVCRSNTSTVEAAAAPSAAGGVGGASLWFPTATAALLQTTKWMQFCPMPSKAADASTPYDTRGRGLAIFVSLVFKNKPWGNLNEGKLNCTGWNI